MAPEERRSGRRYFSPSLVSHAIFSHVTITSPNAASTKGLPESMEATLPKARGISGQLLIHMKKVTPCRTFHSLNLSHLQMAS